MTGPRTDTYLEATHLIPAGETRTFAELAALAGRPGAARAAGRAVAACPIDAPHPWHRVVSSDGSLARDGERARAQRERLQAEGVLASGAEKVAARAAEGARSVPRPKRRPRAASPASASLEARLAALDWTRAVEVLRAEGAFVAPGLLAEAECVSLIAAYDDDARFERTIEMGPRGYGVGTYRYWKEPIPEPARSLRAGLYDRLRAPAGEAPGAVEYPPSLAEFWDRCRASGQKRAASILLRYGEGGINFPHRDIYGRQWFPYQAVAVLSRRGADFEGGEFVLFEEAPGEGSRERAFALDAGDLLVFASRGYSRPRAGPSAKGRALLAELHHGMRAVTRGERFALGLVLHLAE
jgi:alkylated DNA nucleotide flippase Atl1